MVFNSQSFTYNFNQLSLHIYTYIYKPVSYEGSWNDPVNREQYMLPVTKLHTNYGQVVVTYRNENPVWIHILIWNPTPDEACSIRSLS